MPEPIVEVKTLVQEMGTAFEEFKTAHSKAQKDGDVLLKEQLAKMAEDITAKHELATKRIDEMEARAKRPLSGGSVEQEQKEAAWAVEFTKTFRALQSNPVPADAEVQADLEGFRAYRKSFVKYLRRSDRALSPDEYKALSVGSDPDGGYWIVPPEMSARITTRIFETSPMRDLATVETIGTHEYKIPEDPNEASAGWTGETTTRSESNTPVISMKSITPQELYGMPKATQQLLEDGMVDIEAWLARKAADKIARLENTAFVGGSGSVQPRGFLTYTNGTTWGTVEQIPSTSSGAFTYTGLLNIMTALKEPYHASAVWMIRRQSIASIMLLTDGSNRLIFQPILGGNFNNTPLLGYTIKYATDMPAIAASALSAAFGDFKAGYTIVDRVGLSLIRDNVTSKGNVLFYFRKRTGGDVVDYDAIKIQKLSVS